jgi:ligand-binding sensor domain-containing protein
MAPSSRSEIRCLLVCLLLVLALSARAASANSSWFARPWQTDDGLPNNTVAALAQTPDGYLWVATPVGLARFDGDRFEEIPLTNYVAEPNRGVLAMASSRSGGLWLAMDRGPILGLNGGTPQVFTVTNGLPDQTAEKLTEAGDGSVWVGYRSGTICRIQHFRRHIPAKLGRLDVVGRPGSFPPVQRDFWLCGWPRCEPQMDGRRNACIGE